MDLNKLRQDYGVGSLTRADLILDPFRLFENWFAAAIAAEIPEPHAMCLATATATGLPSVRWLLLKGSDRGEFAFVTNFESRKARELAQNPHGALGFHWQPLERQVRIEGTVRQGTEAESDRLFNMRPRGARLGAWSSPQSQPIANRDELESRLAATTSRYEKGEIPRPPFWGAYFVKPTRFEFWQGRSSRLHDRFLFELAPDGSWSAQRLAP